MPKKIICFRLVGSDFPVLGSWSGDLAPPDSMTEQYPWLHPPGGMTVKRLWQKFSINCEASWLGGGMRRDLSAK